MSSMLRPTSRHHLPEANSSVNTVPPILAARANLWRCTVLAVVAVLGGLVLFWFDPNQYPFYPVCAFHKVTGLLCPGCGSLRATHQLLHGHLAAAFRFNPLLLAMLPFLAGSAGQWFLRTSRGERGDLVFWPKWWWVLLVVAVAFTIWRNIPGSPFSTLPQ